MLSEKLFSVRDKVNVMDLNKNPLGIFARKLLVVGGAMYRLYDVADEDTTISTVKEKLIAVRPTYTFYRGDEKDANELGKLRQELVSFGPKFWFEDPSGNTRFRMKGNLLELHYKIFKEDNPVAEINRELFHIRDAYGVRMDPRLDDDTAMLVLGIVIMLHHEREEREERG